MNYWMLYHHSLVEFWRLMVYGCWVIFPCTAVPL